MSAREWWQDTSYLSHDGGVYMGLNSDLLAWRAAYPPDANEQLRNDLVATFQGNRNPFIDHPEWAECLFSCQCLASPPARIFGSGFEQSE